ncbi:MAG: ATP-dependent helicase [Christensenellales bacterium]|jgi:DNA helicase-2/ATP-dependent DNA helicase PcrA
MIDLTHLNEEQRAAVLDTEGQVLVFAGAGSGKTRVLTYRIAYLADEKKVSPYNILAITFTNKATNEMKERIMRMVNADCDVWVSTFHSFCASVLRRDIDKLGFDTRFTIYNESDSARIIKNILGEVGISEEQKKKYKWHISNAKNEGLTPAEYKTQMEQDGDAEDVYKVYTQYERILKSNNALDFDDLLIKTEMLFRTCPEVLEKYQKRFRYIHVDEFQDTNAIQFTLVRQLSGYWGNLFVVGDDDQSIYGWRGADIRNILQFKEIYKSAKIYRLQQNYRSTGAILGCANNVIKNNTQRHDKKLFTAKGEGAEVTYFTAYNDHIEAEWVMDNIVSLKRAYGYSYSDFAILVRVNSLTRLFEKKFSDFSIPYKLYGGLRFFDRKEVQDVIAYLRIIVNPNDTQAIERVINCPRRGIGEATVQALINRAQAKGTRLIDEIENIESNKDLSAKTRARVLDFALLIKDIKEAASLPLSEYIVFLINRVGFEEYYLQSGKEEDKTRWENILELAEHTAEFSRSFANADLHDFLETVFLAPEEKDEDEAKDAVVIATMHSAKGLEFKVVFIVGCEEEVFPSSQSIREGLIEEERRIMYVAITRAKERLFISGCTNRFRYNQTKTCVPSRFVEESKGNKRVSFVQERFGKADNAFTYQPLWAQAVNLKQAEKPALKNEEEIAQIKAGSIVEHNKYGKGTVLEVSGSGRGVTATIAFSGLGIKKFALESAPLKLADKE